MRSEDFLVHVKAQVMSRDDNKGGWVPRGAGGMSIISLCRLPPRSSSPADVTSRELLIYGRRIADKSVTRDHQPWPELLEGDRVLII